MHISDTALECSRRCAQLALKCTDEEIAVELNVLAVQLMAAAVRDAESLLDASTNTALEEEQPSPATGLVSSDPPDLIRDRHGSLDTNTPPRETRYEE
ncbi:MAG: hypothetical protein Q7V17_14570 [Afipia sp.]|nr:hypothetical protein [Afipia sp.]